MPKEAPTIVVAGDVTVDWLQTAAAAADAAPGMPNWRLHEGTRMVARPGGAMLLARLVERASGGKVATHRLDDLENIPPARVIHSVSDLALFPDDGKSNERVYRVKRFGGFAGPADGPPAPLPVVGDDPAAGVGVTDGAG